MKIRKYHWFIALSFATAIHLAFALGFEKTARASGGAPAGAGSIQLDLGTGEEVGAVLSALPVDASDALESLDSVQALPPDPQVAMVQPLSVPSLAPLDAGVLVPLKSVPEVRASAPPRKKRVARAIKPHAKARRIPRAKPSKARVRKKTGSRHRLASRGHGGGEGGRGSARGSGSGIGAGAGAGSGKDYGAILAAWLNKYKRYPRQAQRLGQQGTTRVRFTIDRSGKLLSFRILRSSGYRLLDQAVRSLVKRADPMPPIPKTLAKAKLTVTVPIRFSLH